jgi:hypothetical protein
MTEILDRSVEEFQFKYRTFSDAEFNNLSKTMNSRVYFF